MKVIKWEPGNGTRYEVSITRLPVAVHGYKAGDYMVVGPWPDRHRVMFLPDMGGILTMDTVARHLGLSPHDASVVALMVAPHTGREPVTIEGLFAHYGGQARCEPTVIETL